jgi:hypothetical protein
MTEGKISTNSVRFNACNLRRPRSRQQNAAHRRRECTRSCRGPRTLDEHGDMEVTGLPAELRLVATRRQTPGGRIATPNHDSGH